MIQIGNTSKHDVYGQVHELDVYQMPDVPAYLWSTAQWCRRAQGWVDDHASWNAKTKVQTRNLTQAATVLAASTKNLKADAI